MRRNAIPLDDAAINDLWDEVTDARDLLLSRKKPKWDRHLALYTGAQPWDGEGGTPLGFGDALGDSEAVRVNWTAAGLTIKFSGDTATAPRFTVSPRDGIEDPLLRPILSEYFTRRFNGPSGCWRAATSAKLDAHVFGTGAVLVGWRDGLSTPMPTDDDSLRMQEAVESQMEQGYQDMLASGAFDPGDLKPPDFSEQYRIRGAGAVAYRISPYDLVVPVDARWDAPQDSRFLGRCYAMDRAKLVRAGYDMGGVEGVGSWDQGSVGRRFLLDPIQRALTGRRQKRPRVSLAEVWFREVEVKKTFRVMDGDIRRTYPPGIYNIRLLWATERPGQPLRFDLWPTLCRDEYGTELYPFAYLVNREVPGDFFGQGDVEIAEEQQRVLDIEHSLMVDHISKSKEKYMVQKGELSQEALEALESPNTREVIETQSHPSAGPIAPVPRSSISFEFVQAMAAERESLNAITGVSDAARGAAIPGANTATEARLVAGMSGGRSARDAEKFETFLCDIGTLWWEVARQFEAGDEVLKVRMPGPNGQAPTVKTVVLGREMLVPVDISLTTGATRLQDMGQRLERKERFFAMVAQSAQLQAQSALTGQPAPINMPFFLQLYAEDAQVTDDMDALFSPPPPPPPPMPPPGMAPEGAPPQGQGQGPALPPGVGPPGAPGGAIPPSGPTPPTGPTGPPGVPPLQPTMRGP